MHETKKEKAPFVKKSLFFIFAIALHGTLVDLSYISATKSTDFRVLLLVSRRTLYRTKTTLVKGETETNILADSTVSGASKLTKPLHHQDQLELLNTV